MTIGSRRLGVLAVGLLALALAGCSKAGGSDGGSTPTTPPPLAAGGPPGSARATASGTSTAPVYPKDAAAYTRAAIAAWAAGDVSTLDNYEDSGGELHTMLACNGCYNKAFTLS